MIYKFLASVSLLAAFTSFLLAGATGEASFTLSASLTLVSFLSFVLATIKG